MEQPPEAPRHAANGAPESRQPQPLFDPYTGERLPGALPPVPPTSGRRSSGNRSRTWAFTAAGTAAVFLLAVVVGAVIGHVGPFAKPDSKGQTGAQRLKVAEARCQKMIGDAVAAARAVDGRVTVGINFSSYSDAVGTAQVAKNAVDDSAITSNSFCASALAGIGVALVDYTTALSTWNDCIQSEYCDSSDVDLTPQWTKASDMLAMVDVAMRTGKPINSPLVTAYESINGQRS